MPVTAKNATPRPGAVSAPCERGPWAGTDAGGSTGREHSRLRAGPRVPAEHGGQGRPPPAAPPERRERAAAPRRGAGPGAGGARCRQPGRRSQPRQSGSRAAGRGWAGCCSRCSPRKWEKQRLRLPGPSRAVWMRCPYSAGAGAAAGHCERSASPVPRPRKGETKLGILNTFKFSRRFCLPSLGFLRQTIRKMTRKTTAPQPTAMRMTRYRGR